MLKENARYDAVDAAGRRHTVIHYIEAAWLANPRCRDGEPFTAVELANGAGLKRLDKGKYQIAGTSTVLTATSPDAP